MTISVAVQMDPIAGIAIKADTTFALMLEAQARGYRLFYYTPDQLSYGQGRVQAHAARIEVFDVAGDHFRLGPIERIDLADMDIVLLRQDPPFDMAYITTTHILEALPRTTLVVNDPASVRNAPEKLLVMGFPDLMPPTLITRSREDIWAFRAEHRDIIVKPLFGNGGAGVFRITPDDTNLGALVELFSTIGREPFIVQRYLEAVRTGDKRIILIDGQPLGALNRVPAADDTRSNLHVGGRAEATALTDRDRVICDRIGPELVQRGLLLAGIDVIGDFITEINITSPTGLRAITALGGPDLTGPFWDAAVARLAARRAGVAALA